MNKQTWMIAGGIAVIAVIVGYLVKNKTSQADGAQSQLPAQNAAANYTVPPDIGASVDNTGGVTVPSGDNVTYTTGQGNSLPITPFQ